MLSGCSSLRVIHYASDKMTIANSTMPKRKDGQGRRKILKRDQLCSAGGKGQVWSYPEVMKCFDRQIMSRKLSTTGRQTVRPNRNKTKLRLDEVPTKRQKAERRWKSRHHKMLNVKQKTSYKKTLWLKSDSIETKSLILFRQLVLPEDVQLWTYSYEGQRFSYAAWSQTAAQ